MSNKKKSSPAVQQTPVINWHPFGDYKKVGPGKKPVWQQLPVVDPSAIALTVVQASAVSGLTPWQVRRFIWEGKLTAKRSSSRDLIIRRADLDAFLESLPNVEPSQAQWLAKRTAVSA